MPQWASASTGRAAAPRRSWHLRAVSRTSAGHTAWKSDTITRTNTKQHRGHLCAASPDVWGQERSTMGSLTPGTAGG